MSYESFAAAMKAHKKIGGTKAQVLANARRQLSQAKKSIPKTEPYKGRRLAQIAVIEKWIAENK